MERVVNPSLLSAINWKGAAAALFVLAMLSWAGSVRSQSSDRVADVRNTPHNLSTAGKGPWTTTGGFGTFDDTKMIRATSETEICVFCHTPHGASTPAAGKPLWNRSMGSSTYTKYSSESIQSADLISGGYGVSNSSKLCLSCHDGTVTIGSVTNAPGSGFGSGITTTAGDNTGCMPMGAGVDAGRTRNLGGNLAGCGDTTKTVDLSNDHPISFTYDTTLTGADGELRSPGGAIANPTPGVRPKAPLNNSMVECATCHDPHVKQGTTSGTYNGTAGSDPAHNIKFLRLNRFQVSAPGGSFSDTGDISCLACHNKDGWVGSAHADSSVANETYKATGTFLADRDFPTGIQVWQAACLNCHDTHTAKGARRLARAGTSGGLAGGNSAIEETCYQCHRLAADAAITIATTGGKVDVPDIRTEFTTANNRTMPIALSTEKHAIKDKDFIEDALTLGKDAAANRHVECTDCHNPHRVVRNTLFNKQGDAAVRTHVAGGTGTVTTGNRGADGNLASGVLRGTWGVEPVFGSLEQEWPQRPTGFTVKKGVPTDNNTGRGEAWLTREYQLCFKCHSTYGTGSSTSTDHPNVGFPPLGSPGTASGINGVTNYTNIAAEFGSVSATDPPTTGATGTDQGEERVVTAGKLCTNYTADCNPTPTGPNNAQDNGVSGTNNHRSWHPVMWPTGRSKEERGSATFSNIRAPFDDAVGTQTMHCSDCHGSPASWTGGTGPNTSGAQGPHGSSKDFLLRGDWLLPVTDPGRSDGAAFSGTTPSSPGVCGNCHAPTSGTSGFATGDASHGYEDHNGAPCSNCHIAVPHGWKNKAFLVNLNCVGAEVQGHAAGCTAKTPRYNAPPYYRWAVLAVRTWAQSGAWAQGNCGNSTSTGSGWMQNNCGSW